MSKSRLVPILIATLLVSPAALADLRFSLVGAGTLSQHDFTNNYPSLLSVSDTTSAKLGFGGGLLVGFPLSSSIELQVGGLYVNRKYHESLTTSSSNNVDVSFYTVEVPVTVNFWLGNYFSIDLGGYVALGPGGVNQTDSSGNTLAGSFSDAALAPQDYGLLGGLRFQVPLGSSFALMAEGQYLFGLNNVMTAGTVSGLTVLTEHFRDIQVLVGFTIGGGSSRYSF